MVEKQVEYKTTKPYVQGRIKQFAFVLTILFIGTLIHTISWMLGIIWTPIYFLRIARLIPFVDPGFSVQAFFFIVSSLADSSLGASYVLLLHQDNTTVKNGFFSALTTAASNILAGIILFLFVLLPPFLGNMEVYLNAAFVVWATLGFVLLAFIMNSMFAAVCSFIFGIIGSVLAAKWAGHLNGSHK